MTIAFFSPVVFHKFCFPVHLRNVMWVTELCEFVNLLQLLIDQHWPKPANINLGLLGKKKKVSSKALIDFVFPFLN